MGFSLALRSRRHRLPGETLSPRTRQNGAMTSLNSFGSKMTLNVQGRDLTYYSLRSDALLALGVDRLPYSIKVLLENLLRHEDGVKVSADDIEALARWGENPTRHGESAGEHSKEIAFTPARVLMQDLTGVPAVVDLAAMRHAMAQMGGDPARINPLAHAARGQAYPDTLLGTDSHTTMVNGLGVLGWGVGGIEAEAAMLGQPVSMLI